MRREIRNWVGAITCGTCLLGFSALGGRGASSPAADSHQAPTASSTSGPSLTPIEERALITKYCQYCHNDKLMTGGLSLQKVDPAEVSQDGEIWEKVVRKLGSGEMPPFRMPRPDAAVSRAFVAQIRTALDQAALLHPNPGHIAVHRLNRNEYANVIRDLLAVNIDAKSLFVADDVDQHGFDNDANVLSVSPALMEQYMSAAGKVSRIALGSATTPPSFETYKISPMVSQEERMSDLPFGSRGGASFSYRFPADGEYMVKVRLRRQLYGYILGMGRPHQLEVRLNGKRLHVFTVGGDAPAGGSPASFSGNIMNDPKWDLYMHHADDGLEVRFPAKAGVSDVAVSFIGDPVEPEGVEQPKERGFGLTVNEEYDGNPSVDSIIVGGPYNVKGLGETASRRKLLVCQPTSANDLPCARRILAVVARRAYRRPVTEHELQTLLGFFESGAKDGGFEAGVGLALQRLLADPNFLFRIEHVPAGAKPGTVYPLSDLELASRLSFFLWSSIPDDELLNLAVRGQLKAPGVLEHQVRRMLADDRSTAIVDNFVSDWLELDKTRSLVPDPVLFPDFDENLREGFLTETKLFVESQIRSDQGIADLLDADYTYVNDQLARHYGIPNVYGTRFRRVDLTGTQRGGLLTEGSILMTTSYPNRTSPVLRGKWILENVLGSPPPPPPPNVPGLKDTGANGLPTSIRARMEEHRKNPTCAVCHVRMDPLGFAMERYDSVGAWREMSDGSPIDTSATLPDGTKFNGAMGLRQFLLGHRDDFVNTFTRKLMTYALGRGVEYYDLPTVRAITSEAAPHNYSWSAIILGIVKSPPFQMSIVPGVPSNLEATEKHSKGTQQSSELDVRRTTK